MPIVNYLHTIVISGYWGEEQWRSWAEELILYNSELDNWIYDVAFSQNRDELLLAIAHERDVEIFDKETLYWEPNVIVGYYYLMYQEGRMDLLELLSRFLDEDDISSETNLFDSQEGVYMLKKMRKGEADIEKINRLLMPMAKVAMGQLEKLRHYKRI